MKKNFILLFINIILNLSKNLNKKFFKISFAVLRTNSEKKTKQMMKKILFYFLLDLF